MSEVGKQLSLELFTSKWSSVLKQLLPLAVFTFLLSDYQ